MKISFADILVCPKTKTKLTLMPTEVVCDEVVSGTLSSEGGDVYPIVNGIPVLLLLDDLEKNTYALDLFKNKAEIYDQYQHLSFETFCQNEEDVRRDLIKRLFSGGREDGGTILEVSSGTGRDSLLIKQLMGPCSVLHVQDISMDMLRRLKEKFNPDEICITQSNAGILPYPSGYFDRIYSFGGVGMNIYADNKALFAELARVAKTGAKVVLGGLSLAPWLYETEFGRILRNHNPHYENKIKLEDVPVGARDVSLSWILNGAGFCLEFTVGSGEPAADFDFEIPGERGGTLRSRYYGRLEGVTPEAKRLAMQARDKLGVSMHQWLDELIMREARCILADDME